MVRCLVLCATVFLTAFSPSPSSVAPSASPGGPSASPESSVGLAEALTHVPDTDDARGQLIGYVDYRAVESARPGAAQPASWAALEALRAADDPSAQLWLEAYFGIGTGSSDLLRSSQIGGTTWPELLGLDFFDIDRQVSFGAPPGNGDVLLGRFDPGAITAAFGARGYTSTNQGGRTLLCGADGCEAGSQVHVDQRDPGNPFGGDLGRSEPLAVSATELDSSASIATVRAILDADGGTAPSLGDDPGYRATAEAATADGTVIQATLVPGAMVSAGVAELLARGNGSSTAADPSAASVNPIPAYDLLFLADGATDTEQIVRIGLVYQDPADAQQAVDAVPGRIDTVRSLVTGEPVRQLLDERGVTSVEGRVVPSSDGTRSVAVIELRAPLASNEPDPGTGLITASSIVYKTLVTMLQRRDLLWLAPNVPTPG